MIIIIDYHSGNPASIKNMLKKIGVDSIVTEKIDLIEKAEKIIIPGVGKFDYGAMKLRELGMTDILNHKALVEKIPILGICLGYQLMTRKSEEGNEKGLCWLAADTVKFKKNGFQMKIPHMGWNNVIVNKQSPIFMDTPDDNRFYFVHSYYVRADNREDEIGITNYFHPFAASMQKENIFGVQFHPEKSHKFGMQVLNSFVRI